jgi:hypothetical protein
MNGIQARMSFRLAIVAGNPYTCDMTSVANIHAASTKHAVRVARAEFVRELIESEERSVRYVALKIGLSPSTLSERLSGKNAFLADEIEAIAPIVRKTPTGLFSEYIAIVGPTGLEPMTSTV